MTKTENKMTTNRSIIILVLSMATLLVGVLVIKAPTTVVLIFSGLVTMFLSMMWGVEWEDIMEDILIMARRMFPSILILMFVGMLVGAWIISGTVPTMIYYGLKLLSPSIFLFASVILCSLMSIMTGTSWGTMSTVGIALLGVGTGLGIPAYYTVGSIITGALFGDKLSPMSDTTILAPAVSGVDVITHIKYMLYTTVPSYTISLIFFLILGRKYAGGIIESEAFNTMLLTLENSFTMSPLLLLPPVIVLFLIYKRKPVIPVFAVGIIVGCIFALIFQNVDLRGVLVALNNGFTTSTGVEIVDTMLLRGGIRSMFGAIAVIIAASLFGAPLQTSGVINVIVDKMKTTVTSQKSLMFLSHMFHMILISTIGGYYTTFSMAGPMLSPLYDEYNLDRVNLSRMLEDTGTTFSVLVPWSSNGVFIAGTLGLTAGEYGLYTPIAYLCVIFGLIYVFTGFRIAQAKPKVEANKI